MNDKQDKRFALLIDGDNIGSQYIRTIVDEITKFGIITYKRIYGDWTQPHLNNWKDVLLEYSITPMQQYSYTTGKNATDSAMIIDAMDILYAGNVDGFCLASSDSDFTKLAARLREAGMIVIGMGKQQTPRPFVTACSQFKYIDIIGMDSTTSETEQNSTASPANQQASSKKASKAKTSSTTDPSVTKKADVQKYIKKCIEENSEDDGYMLVSDLGLLLPKKYPDFDPRNFGNKKLTDLLEKWGFELKKTKDPHNKKNPSGLIVYVK